MAFVFDRKMLGLFPVSKRMRFPPYSTSAAYPQSFFNTEGFPKAS